jgi:predicted glycosyltransferase
VRVWVDISNSPQPLVALLQERGHEVQVPTREYAQTTELLALHGIPHEVIGPGHGGAGTGLGCRAARRVIVPDAIPRADGTRSHEAVALGVPVYRTFAGEFGAVDSALVNEGRLRVLTSANALVLERRARAGERVERDASLLLDLMLSGLEG